MKLTGQSTENISQTAHQTVDDSVNTGDLNGKTCSTFELEDNSIRKLITRGRNSLRLCFKQLKERIITMCQSTSLAYIISFFSTNVDKKKADIKTHDEVNKTPLDSIGLVKELAFFLASGYKEHDNVYRRHEKLFALIHAIDKAADFETQKSRPRFKDMAKDSVLDVATASLTFGEKCNFSNYLKYEEEGKRFCEDNFQKPDYETLQTLRELIERQILQGIGKI